MFKAYLFHCLWSSEQLLWLCQRRSRLLLPTGQSSRAEWSLLSSVYMFVIKRGQLVTYTAADISSVSPSPQGSFYVPSENYLQRAHTWHRRLCRLLLVAHRGLHAYYTALMKEIPQLQQIPLESGGAHTQSWTHCFIEPTLRWFVLWFGAGWIKLNGSLMTSEIPKWGNFNSPVTKNKYSWSNVRSLQYKQSI